MVIYAIESKAEMINKKLVELSFGYTFHTKYISFKNTDSQTRIRYLHANNYRNMQGKFEILHNTDANKIILVSNDK